MYILLSPFLQIWCGSIVFDDVRQNCFFEGHFSHNFKQLTISEQIRNLGKTILKVAGESLRFRQPLKQNVQ